jgi:hypothetical protein
MWLISVTPEVFQLETFLLKEFLPRKSPLILVIVDTSQVSMGPYVKVALSGSSSKAWTASSSSSLLANTWGGAGGPREHLLQLAWHFLSYGSTWQFWFLSSSVPTHCRQKGEPPLSLHGGVSARRGGGATGGGGAALPVAQPAMTQQSTETLEGRISTHRRLVGGYGEGTAATRQSQAARYIYMTHHSRSQCPVHCPVTR